LSKEEEEEEEEVVGKVVNKGSYYGER